KRLAMEKVRGVAEREVQALVRVPAGNNNYGVLVQLDAPGRLALDALSVERSSCLLFVFINGRPITEFQIDKRITDGQVYIAAGLTAADIELMKKDWRMIGQRKR